MFSVYRTSNKTIQHLPNSRCAEQRIRAQLNPVREAEKSLLRAVIRGEDPLPT